MQARIHISIPVSDITASVAFYSQVFNTQPSKLKDDYANFRLESPVALHLSLVYQPGLTQRTAESMSGQHFGVELFEDQDLADWKAQVKASGIAPHREEEQVTCCYAVADKFWLQDPDGHAWEFWVRHDDNGASLYSDENTDSTCCTPTASGKVDSCCA